MMDKNIQVFRILFAVSRTEIILIDPEFVLSCVTNSRNKNWKNKLNRYNQHHVTLNPFIIHHQTFSFFIIFRFDADDEARTLCKNHLTLQICIFNEVGSFLAYHHRSGICISSHIIRHSVEIYSIITPNGTASHLS